MSPEKRIKTAPIALRMRPELKAAAEAAAKADHRSLTSLVEKLLTDYCRKKGFLRDDDLKSG
jgi:predicted HicB family RNase H-like nuclease